ncbi:DUF2294 domain-containing protein [Brevibacillus fulvus]|uniref:Uncharacterized protein YbcI n=1 Tax=Brevibacillus fulvus TaxID=1125967 RepID=A0A938XYQ9_9BACL|nr:Na-translocating system protein MpsC family protein [Brevibacillus fulvus]MBM7590649.1 uncharacterized protein YbcI [Brevibacillus fulvus]
MEIATIEKELGSFIGRLLRDNFGKGPESIFVSVSERLISIYLRNFFQPMERILFDQGQEELIARMRNLMMNSLIPEIKTKIHFLTNNPIKSVYYDWNLSQKSGMILIVSANPFDHAAYLKPDFEGQEILHRQMIAANGNHSDQMESLKLNDRTILVMHSGAFTKVEQELIHLGFDELVLMAKKNVVKSFLEKVNFESFLLRQVRDIFLLYNAEWEQIWFVFMLGPNKRGSEELGNK